MTAVTMMQWRHEPPAPNFWAKTSAPHSDSVQIYDVTNLYNRTVSPTTKVVRLRLIIIIFPGEDLKHTFPNHF